MAIAVGVMIETAAGITEAEVIAAAPLIDFVVYGASDLGISVGGDAAALEAACAAVLRACVGAEKVCGIFTPDHASARRRAREGFGFVIVCTDILAAHETSAAAATGCRDAAE